MTKAQAQWQQELHNFKGIKSLFVIEGNTTDIYPRWTASASASSGEETLEYLDLADTIRAIYAQSDSENPYHVLFYDPLSRFMNQSHTATHIELLAAASKKAAELQSEEARFNALGGSSQASSISPFEQDSRIIRALLSNSLYAPSTSAPGAENWSEIGAMPRAVVINMASRLLTSPNANDPEEVAFFTNLLAGIRQAIRPDGLNKNSLILLVDNMRDLPDWFTANNPNLRLITIPGPDRDTRNQFVHATFALPETTTKPEEKTARETFVDKTDGMTLRELDELRRMAVRLNSTEAELPSLVEVYKYGLKQNKWASIIGKLENNPEDAIRRRVKGQDRAVKAVVSVLKRSALGLSGATHSSSSKPKGILFLSGPTGTGKTEIVKAVTELLFGDERSMLRFDMSEYQAENADQKLFGAPPGYVGYAEGGQLTNAVRTNPFSVILFDEVEKAHPSIMDKFLQILEDGRMTDGQGNTVYFSETIIFFTSNIGFSQTIYDPSGRHVIDHKLLIEPGKPYDEIHTAVSDAMKAAFKPEFLGRIGNNIVVFDYLDDSSAFAIVRSRIEQINETILKTQGITINTSEAFIEALGKRALSTDIKEKGGRGIGNLIESEYLNVLSDYIFDHTINANQTLLIDVDEQTAMSITPTP